MPTRVQRKRQRGWTAPLDAQGRKPIYVGRPTIYGNPIRVDREPGSGLWIVHLPEADGVKPRQFGDYQFKRQALQVAVDAFRAALRTPGGAEQAELFAAKLHGRDLMCWCPLDEPCHADVLLAVARGEAP